MARFHLLDICCQMQLRQCPLAASGMIQAGRAAYLGLIIKVEMGIQSRKHLAFLHQQ